MKMNRVFLLFYLLLITVGVYSQNVKPEFRVVISTVSVSGEDETTPKDNFNVGEAIKLKVEITNLAGKRQNVPKGTDYSRPTLFRDGQLIPYRKEVTDREKRNYRSLTGMLYPKPNEIQTEILDLNEYYEPLGPGKYQLSLERLFYKIGDIPSNAVVFEVRCSKKYWTY